MAQPPSPIAPLFLRRQEAASALGIRKSSFIKLRGLGLLPPPVTMGVALHLYATREIEAVAEARLAGASDEDVAALVKSLVAQRAAAAPDLD